MAWARRMDEGLNPGENEEPKVRLGLFRRPDKKTAAGGLIGFMTKDALMARTTRGVGPAASPWIRQTATAL
jgi:hypothetical protein